MGVIPGDPGYNDFWLVHKVIVPEDYVANTVRPWPMEYALSNSFGFGGTNAALLFKRFQG